MKFFDKLKARRGQLVSLDTTRIYVNVTESWEYGVIVLLLGVEKHPIATSRRVGLVVYCTERIFTLWLHEEDVSFIE